MIFQHEIQPTLLVNSQISEFSEFGNPWLNSIVIIIIIIIVIIIIIMIIIIILILIHYKAHISFKYVKVRCTK